MARKSIPGIDTPRDTKPTALEQYRSFVADVARRTAAVGALPPGSPERKAALADLERWRNEVMRPTDAALWARVVEEGGGCEVEFPAP